MQSISNYVACMQSFPPNRQPYSGLQLKLSKRGRRKEECQPPAHYTVHLDDTCTLFYSHLI